MLSFYSVGGDMLYRYRLEVEATNVAVAGGLTLETVHFVIISGKKHNISSTGV
jgi:hypothetical protein